MCDARGLGCGIQVRSRSARGNGSVVFWPGCRPAVHSTMYLHVDFAVVDNVMEFVVCDYFVGNGGDGDEHVFVILHWCAKIVVFNVQAEPTSTWGRQCAVL